MSQTITKCLVAFVMLLSLCLALTADDKPKPNPLNLQLGVQSALCEGLELIRCRDFAKAVTVLESQLAYINGNRAYLLALRDAYAGFVVQLKAENRMQELRLYTDRLAILEPSAAQRPPVTARPKIDQPDEKNLRVNQTDPFHPSNSAQNAKLVTLLEQATRAFEAKQFEAAGVLYERAATQSPGDVAKYGDQWGYCMLYAVANRLKNGDVLQPELLEREIAGAEKRSPKLKNWADQLRQAVRKSATSVNVTHTPAQNGSWARAETTNFRIFHTSDEQTGDKIAQIAEATRVAMTRKWFQEEPTDWTPRCDIYIYPTGQGYAKATGAPATAPGHSTIDQPDGRITKRRIDLRGDDPNMLIGVLPHETTHIVLAGRFGAHYVPRWADEGMAVLSEPRERVELHLRNLPTHQRENGLFRVSELMGLNDYPEPRRVGPFYAQSVSLVDFLCKKRDPATFAVFLREALDNGYEASLRRHFGYDSFVHLERDWRQHAFPSASVVSNTPQR